jgi:hypothetical protein
MALISKDCEDIENLLALNPKVNLNASWKPSIVTKAEKKKWKRNQDKSCSVSPASGNSITRREVKSYSGQAFFQPL